MKYTLTTLGGIRLSANARFPVFHCLLLHNTTFPLLLFQFLSFLSPSLCSTLLLSLYSILHSPHFLFPFLLLFCSSSLFYPRCLHIDPPRNLLATILESPPSLSCMWNIPYTMDVEDIRGHWKV